MSIFSVFLRTKIIDMCLDAFFDRVTVNLTVIKTLNLKVGDHFSMVYSKVHDIVDFTNVDIVEVGTTYVVFDADSVIHGDDITGVIKATNHGDLMTELNEWEFIP